MNHNLKTLSDIYATLDSENQSFELNLKLRIESEKWVEQIHDADNYLNVKRRCEFPVMFDNEAECIGAEKILKHIFNLEEQK